ncbi:transmembrane amino acid transporter protein-domain-containing protein [Vararia minispora EC-137]|uniref:Transmembrane amino acid transporter protein-domain-containing protein n=1 Tax=Vararia minispora EC-137 TaxID=1314806 RepID=A0ACB8QP11_9AGAM|nr:transmembrane amino acid transporter protein-domain-containing protein [Vararia minispora EC-137]
MTSTIDPEPAVGSYASSICDIIASHHRLRYQATRQIGEPASFRDAHAPAENLECTCTGTDGDEDQYDCECGCGNTRRPRYTARTQYGATNEWQSDLSPALSGWARANQPHAEAVTNDIHAPPTSANERAPLLHCPPKAAPRRRASSASLKPARPPGRSTFRQTLFNACALLLGVGMLSEPLAFACAGWVGGTLLVIFYGFVTCYTAKFLARIAVADPSVRSYADIGRRAFGPRATPFISTLFFLEILTSSVVIETLFADSLHAVLPALSATSYKLLSLVFMIPAAFLPLWALSYTSLTGILSTIALLLVILIDGLVCAEAPGSLRDPAPTHLLPRSGPDLGLAFGLFMAGFSAHAAMPSVVADMAEPHRFEEAMNYAFGFGSVFYALIGAAGYLMFGDGVHEEISQNLLGVPEYSAALNKAVLWMLVFATFSKFPLSLRSVNIMLEGFLGLEDAHSECLTDAEHRYTPDSKSVPAPAHPLRRRMLLFAERTMSVVLAVGTSIALPDFGATMAILGACTTTVLCVLGPLAAMRVLEGPRARDVVLFALVVPMAVWGTIVAVMAE